MEIQCVEDDASIRDIEVYTLNSTDFEAKGFPDAVAFRDALTRSKPDLIILDIMLPGEDGVELLKFLKDSPDTCRIPIIMATAKGMEYMRWSVMPRAGMTPVPMRYLGRRKIWIGSD